MTIEEKKQYLKRYKRAYQKIKVLEEEIVNIRLEALPSGIDYSKDKIQTTPTNDQMMNYAAKLEELEAKLHKIRCKSIDICNEILDTISTINNDTYQTLLHRRYILLQEWEDIALSMGYSIQWVYLTHCEALAELDIKV